MLRCPGLLVYEVSPGLPADQSYKQATSGTLLKPPRQKWSLLSSVCLTVAVAGKLTGLLAKGPLRIILSYTPPGLSATPCPIPSG